MLAGGVQGLGGVGRTMYESLGGQAEGGVFAGGSGGIPGFRWWITATVSRSSRFEVMLHTHSCYKVASHRASAAARWCVAPQPLRLPSRGRVGCWRFRSLFGCSFDSSSGFEDGYRWCCPAAARLGAAFRASGVVRWWIMDIVSDSGWVWGNAALLFVLQGCIASGGEGGAMACCVAASSVGE